VRADPVRQVHPVRPEGKPARDHDLAMSPSSLVSEHPVGGADRRTGSTDQYGRRSQQTLHALHGSDLLDAALRRVPHTLTYA
jgi:hypothetical protein